VEGPAQGLGPLRSLASHGFAGVPRIGPIGNRRRQVGAIIDFSAEQVVPVDFEDLVETLDPVPSIVFAQLERQSLAGSDGAARCAVR